MSQTFHIIAARDNNNNKHIRQSFFVCAIGFSLTGVENLSGVLAAPRHCASRTGASDALGAGRVLQRAKNATLQFWIPPTCGANL